MYLWYSSFHRSQFSSYIYDKSLIFIQSNKINTIWKAKSHGNVSQCFPLHSLVTLFLRNVGLPNVAACQGSVDFEIKFESNSQFHFHTWVSIMILIMDLFLLYLNDLREQFSKAFFFNYLS